MIKTNFESILKDKGFREKLNSGEIDLTIRNRDGYTLFLYAAESTNYVEQLGMIADYALTTVCKQTLYGYNALAIAIQAHNYEGTTILLEKGFNPNQKDEYSPLFIASKTSVEMLKLLLHYRADVKTIQNNENCLLYVTRKHFPNAVNLLIQNGIDLNFVNEDSKTALHVALEENYTSIVDILLEAGAQLYTEKEPKQLVLTGPIYHFNKELIELLTSKYGVNVNELNDRGETALMHFCSKGTVQEEKDYEMFNYLVSLGADIHIKDEKGRSLMWYALQLGNVDIIHYLEQEGLNLTESLLNNPNMFKKRTKSCISEFLYYVLNHGADINLHSLNEDGSKNYNISIQFEFPTVEMLRALENHFDKMDPELKEEFASNRFKYLLAANGNRKEGTNR
ncbi:ankyrin repeat domain-containing protein [Priestia filamentosa]|uniref:ankyrin repeat domain-containing protein n=1 Tax=Priestia filamentosa TaxID=1402861 RepID=UPI00397963C6